MRSCLSFVAVVIGVLAVTTAVPALVFLLWIFSGNTPPDVRCAESPGTGRIADRGAADTLTRTLDGLPGVAGTAVAFDPAYAPSGPDLVQRVRLTVAFRPDAGRDQVLAAVPAAVDGLRGREFAGLDVSVAFTSTPGAPAADRDGPGYHVFGLPSAEQVRAEATTWFDLDARYRGTRIEVCPSSGFGANHVARVPVVWHGDPATVSATVADLSTVIPAVTSGYRTTVRAVDAADQAYGSRWDFTIIGTLYDEAPSIARVAAALRRPPSLSPVDRLTAVVTCSGGWGDHGPLLLIDVDLRADEARAQAAAAELAARVAAETDADTLDVTVGDRTVLHQES